VFFRHSAWQYTFCGSITAPFGSREEAIEAARESQGPQAEVIVQNPDMQEETVWRPHGAAAWSK
jgi:hypothetical protein